LQGEAALRSGRNPWSTILLVLQMVAIYAGNAGVSRPSDVTKSLLRGQDITPIQTQAPSDDLTMNAGFSRYSVPRASDASVKRRHTNA